MMIDPSGFWQEQGERAEEAVDFASLASKAWAYVGSSLGSRYLPPASLLPSDEDRQQAMAIMTPDELWNPALYGASMADLDRHRRLEAALDCLRAWLDEHQGAGRKAWMALDRSHPYRKVGYKIVRLTAELYPEGEQS